MFRQIPLPGKNVEVKSRWVRVCLFDGTRVLSNIIKIKALCTDKEQRNWTFNHKESEQMQSIDLGEIFIRTNRTDDNIGILFELSVRFVRKSSAEERELTCGWVHLPLFEEGGMPTANRSLELPVNGGTPVEKGVLLDADLGRNEQTSMFRSLIAGNKQPRCTVRLYAPAKEQKDYLDILPDTIIGCTSHMAAFAYYRQILADELIRDRIDMMSSDIMCNPFLATFPRAANHRACMDTLRCAWVEAQKRLNRTQKKDPNVMKNTFMKCYMDRVYPYLFVLPDGGKTNGKTPQFSDLIKSPKNKDILAMLLSADIEHKPFNTTEVAFNIINPHCVVKSA